LGERKSAFGTAWYQLNHASYDKTKKCFHIATWFGVCSYRKLKVTPEKRKEICPICQHELVYINYVGKTCVINGRIAPIIVEIVLKTSSIVREMFVGLSLQSQMDFSEF
jgi:hypothetical protein